MNDVELTKAAIKAVRRVYDEFTLEDVKECKQEEVSEEISGYLHEAEQKLEDVIETLEEYEREQDTTQKQGGIISD